MNAPLNSTGRGQAQVLAQMSRHLSLDAIYSSSLLRAKQTAEEIRQFHPNVVTGEYEDLDEMSFGKVEGQPHDDCRDAMAMIASHWDNGDFTVGYTDGETPLQVELRGRRAIDQILKQFWDGNHILAVAHGRFLKILIASLLYSDLTPMQKLKQSNCCLNVIDYNREAETFHLVRLNETCYLNRT